MNIYTFTHEDMYRHKLSGRAGNDYGLECIVAALLFEWVSNVFGLFFRFSMSTASCDRDVYIDNIYPKWYVA